MAHVRHSCVTQSAMPWNKALSTWLLLTEDKEVGEEANPRKQESGSQENMRAEGTKQKVLTTSPEPTALLVF